MKIDQNQVNQILSKIVELFNNFMKKPEKQIVAKPVEAPKQDNSQNKEVKMENNIDWSNPHSKIAPRFSVGEALTLQSWGVMHVPTEEEKIAMIVIANKVCKAADMLEQKLGKKVIINVHAFMRPEKANIPGSKWDGMDYNRFIYEEQVWANLTPEEKAKKTVPKSPHRSGRAIDFHISGYEGAEKCQEIRLLLAPNLEELGLRMEKIKGPWIHLDDLPVVHDRWFTPY